MLEPLIIIASIAVVVLGPQIWAIRAPCSGGRTAISPSPPVGHRGRRPRLPPLGWQAAHRREDAGDPPTRPWPKSEPPQAPARVRPGHAHTPVRRERDTARAAGSQQPAKARSVRVQCHAMSHPATPFADLRPHPPRSGISHAVRKPDQNVWTRRAHVKTCDITRPDDFLTSSQLRSLGFPLRKRDEAPLPRPLDRHGL
jgi:hypothetical protein